VTTSHNVLVVGAGIGGLTLALQLHQAGIPCQLIEAAPALVERIREIPAAARSTSGGRQIIRYRSTNTGFIAETPTVRMMGTISHASGRPYRQVSRDAPRDRHSPMPAVSAMRHAAR